MEWGTLTLVAGPNGAGKSTLVGDLRLSGDLVDHKILNADDRTLEKAQHAGFATLDMVPADVLVKFFIESANEVYAEGMKLLGSGHNVSLETVLSTDKYREMVSAVLKGDGRFELVYVALRNPAISAERVALRVRKGGHDVPADRLEDRWRRSLEQLKWFAPRATRLSIFDHSTHPAVLIANGEGGRIQWRVEKDSVFPEMRHVLEEAFGDFS